MEKIANGIGLQYKIVVAKSYEEAVRMIKNKEVDMILGIPMDADMIEEMNLTLSLPYFDSHTVLVMAKDQIDKEQIDDKMIYNSEQALKEVNEKKEDGAYIDVYSTNFYLQKKGEFSNITTSVEKILYSFGLVERDNSKLLSLINSFIDTISEEDKQKILYENTNNNIEITWKDFCYQYIWQIGFTFYIIILLIIVYIKLMKDKANRQNELILQQNRFVELSKMMDECLFEYNYKNDEMQIENNRILFNKQHNIRNFMNYPDHEFLKEMMRDGKDAIRDIILNDNREDRWFRVIIKVVKNKQNEKVYVLGRILDVHDEGAERNRLLEKSQRDSLTCLLNRGAGKERIEQLLLEGSSKGIMMLLDVDNFKLVNDQFGHPEGDMLLKKLSDLILQYFKVEDIKCRLGGDEFLIFLHTEFAYKDICDKINEFIFYAKQLVFNKYQEFQVSISVGAAYVSEDVKSYDNLYEKADNALYIAKKCWKKSIFCSK